MSEEAAIEEALNDPNLDERDRSFLEMQKLFEEMSFRERWHKMMTGLKMPHDTGEYKFAKLQLQRLSAPVAAVLVPLIACLLLLLLRQSAPPAPQTMPVDVIEPEPAEEIEPEPPPEDIPPPDELEPIDVDFNGPPSDPTPVETPVEIVSEAFSPQPAEVTTVSFVKSPVVMKGIMSSRTPGMRGKALSRYGAGGGDAVVMHALRWLKMVQNPDGSWDGCRPAMTGLAILTFLAHNELPAGPEEEFGPTVEKAIKWLCEHQDGSGMFSGRDGNNYAQSIATYALCEAYSMTKNPLVKEAAERALAPIIKGQHPSGGWDYNYKQDDRDDISYMGWAAQAIKAGHTAGLQVDGIDNCYSNITKGMLVQYDQSYGGFGYTSPSHSGLSGVGALCMQLVGDYNRPEVKKTMQMLSSAQFGWDKYDGPQPYTLTNGQSPIYFWYYMTQAFFQEGGSAFAGWNKQFLPELIKRQVVEKEKIADLKGKMRDVGYWDSPSASEHHQDGGASFACKRWKGGAEIEGTTTMGRRVQDTCLCALQLMVYYRFLPASQMQNDANKAPSAADAISKAKNKSGNVKVKATRR